MSYPLERVRKIKNHKRFQKRPAPKRAGLFFYYAPFDRLRGRFYHKRSLMPVETNEKKEFTYVVKGNSYGGAAGYIALYPVRSRDRGAVPVGFIT